MRKLLFTVFVIIIALGSSQAQVEPVFRKGDKVLNLGIGLGSTFYTGTYYRTTIPPLSASLEYGMVDNFLDVENLSVGLGGYIGFSSYRWRYSFLNLDYGWNYTNIILGARGSVHYPFIERLDTYAGLILGPRIVISTEYGDHTGGLGSSAQGSGLAYSTYIGGRYFFRENLAVFGELGYGISYLTLGVALKL
jgi:hypothetical protein